jgi:hypothetical protein
LQAASAASAAWSASSAQTNVDPFRAPADAPVRRPA